MRVTKEGVGIKQQLITNDVVLLFAVITNPTVPAGTKDAVKNFSFDFSYWSHDVSTAANRHGHRHLAHGLECLGT